MTDHWPTLRLLLAAGNLPMPEREYRFHPKRRYRADFAWVKERVILEIQGGAWVNGRHNRASGYIAEMERHNEIIRLGWRVIYATPQMLKRGAIIPILKDVLCGKSRIICAA